MGLGTRILRRAMQLVGRSGNLRGHPGWFSKYERPELIRQDIEKWGHRSVIGGMWEQIGSLQADFLKAEGLLPQHAFIDVGSGGFRAGVKLIPYLDPGNYHAIDLREELLEEGYVREIEPAKLDGRFPRANWAATDRFDISMFGRMFDFGIAQSVFTHMPIALLGTCLSAVAPQFRAGGRFYVTVFLAPEAEAGRPFLQVPGNITTSPDCDPIHTTTAALRKVAALAPGWTMTVIGDWQHPRNQQMLCFVRTASG